MGKNYIKKIRRYLSLRYLRNYEEINGWLTENEAIGLYKTAKKLDKNAVVVEIGSWQGKSTICIAKGLKSGKIWAIDPFNADGGFDTTSHEDYIKRKRDTDLLSIFEHNIRKFNVAEKIVTKKGYSYDLHNEFNSINFLFIDGDHSIEGCRKDYELYARKIVKGGFIAFHDYYEDRCELGPTLVVNEIIKNSDEFVFFARYDSLWIGLKT
jgi:predicted O-methyltransferase YrrM